MKQRELSYKTIFNYGAHGRARQLPPPPPTRDAPLLSTAGAHRSLRRRARHERDPHPLSPKLPQPAAQLLVSAATRGSCRS